MVRWRARQERTDGHRVGTTAAWPAGPPSLDQADGPQPVTAGTRIPAPEAQKELLGQAAQAVIQFKAAGVTTLLNFVEALTTANLTSHARSQQWARSG